MAREMVKTGVEIVTSSRFLHGHACPALLRVSKAGPDDPLCQTQFARPPPLLLLLPSRHTPRHVRQFAKSTREKSVADYKIPCKFEFFILNFSTRKSFFYEK